MTRRPAGGADTAPAHMSGPDRAMSHARKELAMLRITQPPATAGGTAEHPLATTGRHLARYGLVVVVACIAALLIAARPLWPRVSAAGSAFAVLLFLGTLSFLFTTPGVLAAPGFPVLSVLPGQFLLKDIVLVSVALWTLGDSLSAARSRSRPAG